MSTDYCFLKMNEVQKVTVQSTKNDCSKYKKWLLKVQKMTVQSTKNDCSKYKK